LKTEYQEEDSMRWTEKKGPARWLIMLAVIAMLAAACSSDDEGATETTEATTGTDAPTPTEPPESDTLTPVKLQLQWFAQAQFAGYYAALAQGFYADAGLDVEILEGAVDIVPATVLDSGAADFAISWVPRGLVPREEGLNITNIGQIFQRSATLQVSFVETGIVAADDLAGKLVGNWGFGNEYELLAGMRVSGLDPATDVTLVQQQFDMLALIAGDIDAAQAMTYNEYAQVLETINPDTGELYQPEDLSVLDWNDYGTAMLQDAIWADADRLESDAEYKDTAIAFLEASLRGWAFCRDNFDDCVDDVLAVGPTLGVSHQEWQLNEINRLIWPSPGGIGLMDELLWNQTVKVATEEGILNDVPTQGAFRTDLVEAALASLQSQGIDVIGDGWAPRTIELLEGGN
jgi:NitT/TauT family transport system substrate-binding protein